MNMRAGEYLPMPRRFPRARPIFGVLFVPSGVNIASESFRFRGGLSETCFSDQTDRRPGVVTQHLAFTECTKAGSVSPDQRSISVSGCRRQAQPPGRLDEAMRSRPS
jgi:hypothetical protein